MWCILRTQCWVTPGLLLALSIALKPHLSGPLLIWLYFQRRYRRTVWLAGGISVFLLLTSIVWLDSSSVSANWFSLLRANFQSANALGGINYPGLENPDAMRMTNLQGAFAAIQQNPRFYNAAAWILSGICLGMWLWCVTREKSSDHRRLFEIASLACLALLPLYHRLEDARLLFLAVPALAWLILNRRAVGLAAACLTGLVLFSISFQPQRFFGSKISTPVGFLSDVARLLLVREAPIALLALTLIYLWALWRIRVPSTPSHDVAYENQIRQ